MRNILPNIDSNFTDVFFTNLSTGEKIEVDSLRINNFSKSSLLDILNEPNAYKNNKPELFTPSPGNRPNTGKILKK